MSWACAARYLDVEDQESFLEEFPAFKPLVPYNSDNRRNVGYLLAAMEGADVLAAVDDDNYVREDEDWYLGHSLVGQYSSLPMVHCSNGWFNPCGMMDYDRDCIVYARGYPYAKRTEPNVETRSLGSGRVVINGGLWLGDPDVDSPTRLTNPAQAVRVNTPRLMLERGVFAPINTQNTTFHRDVIPAFYFVPVGDLIGGVPVERYGDIWAGFFASKVIHQVGDCISFGDPACDHKRNAHNLLNDLELEMWSIRLTDPLAEMLVDWKLTGNRYTDCYLEIADKLEEANWPHKRMAGDFKAFFGRMAGSMRVWVDVCRQIGLERSAESRHALAGTS